MIKSHDPSMRIGMHRYLLIVLLLVSGNRLFAQKEYGFDNRKPSGQPYLPPDETVKRMNVPPGFSVKLFAAEPMMTNPIAMTIDDKGRVWIIESFEYPKRTPMGQAPRDRIVILEDTNGDGVADKRTVFAEGKDFPVPRERANKGFGAFDMASGIEVGYGGCFIGAPPYLWHLKDTKGSGKADSFEVVARGFGSQDTHETLNTFTWGPDGWLYGLHGVFTTSKVKSGENDPGIDMDAAVWRYQPSKKTFEIFAEGTSNPWGMDFNSKGECFLCCCVIPHLFHIVPGGIYMKQGSKPSFNQYAYGALKEICDHTFHKESGWAHAGLLSLDVKHFPKEYQGSLIFGSIHGCSIKRNTLKPNGSTYIGRRADDFLVSGDKNFRPIQMRWAPDGSILVSDWHDQNPCHQTKPDDWDYERGRIYRILPPAKDPISKEDNPFWIKSKFRVADDASDFQSVNQASFLNTEEAIKDENVRAWAVRKLASRGNWKEGNLSSWRTNIRKETSPRVLQEYASAAIRISQEQSALDILEELYQKPDLAKDPVIPFLLWLATERELQRNPVVLLDVLKKHAVRNDLITHHLLARTSRRLAAESTGKELSICFSFIEALSDLDAKQAALHGIADAVQGRQLKYQKEWTVLSNQLKAIKNPEIGKLVQKIAIALNDPAAGDRALVILKDPATSSDDRVESVRQLGAMQVSTSVSLLLQLLREKEPLEVKLAVARGLAAFPETSLASDILSQWNNYPVALRAELVTTLRSRKPWAKVLLEALGKKQIPRSDLNDNVALAIRQFKDAELNTLLDTHYGTFRDSPAEIESLLAKLRKEVPAAAGNATNGKLVFVKHCLQCHKFDGQGHDVGPNLDGAERGMEYLLANVVDPNRVVGTPYFSRTILLKSGKLLNGILVEEDALTLRLKRENAVIEVITKADIEEQSTSTKSLMPEGMTSNMTIQELRDLIRYLQPPAKK